MESKLDSYNGIIKARLQEFPKLSALRLFDEIREPATREVIAGSGTTYARCERRSHPIRSCSEVGLQMLLVRGTVDLSAPGLGRRRCRRSNPAQLTRATRAGGN